MYFTRESEEWVRQQLLREENGSRQMGTPLRAWGWLSAQVPTLSSFLLAALKDESIFILSSKLIPSLFSRSRFLLPLQEMYSTACLLFLQLQQAPSFQYLNVTESFSTFWKTSLNSTSTLQLPFIFHCQTHLNVIYPHHLYFVSHSPQHTNSGVHHYPPTEIAPVNQQLHLL